MWGLFSFARLAVILAREPGRRLPMILHDEVLWAVGSVLSELFSGWNHWAVRLGRRVPLGPPIRPYTKALDVRLGGYDVTMSPENSVEIYQSPDGKVSLEVRADGETVWLNRQQLSILFGRDVKTIGKHISNSLRDELVDYPVVAKFATTADDGNTYEVEHHSLDLVISVGYRVKSPEGVHFRRWANEVLKKYLLEGAAINRKRLAELEKVVEILSRSTMSSFLAFRA